MNSGPQISSSAGRLMLCTNPHRCPLSPPSSRYQRPPGCGSRTIGSGVPSGVSLSRPICATSDANVCSSDARTVISSVMVNVWFLEHGCRRSSSFLLGVRLDAPELSTPVLGEHAAPVVNRAKRLRVRPIQASRRPSRLTVTRPTSRSTCRCFETDGCSSSSASAISPTERSSAAMNSRMCRRRGSAMALNGSDVVEARGMSCIYIFPYGNMSSRAMRASNGTP